MDPDPTDRLLERYARQPLPSAPEVVAEVWREIEKRRSLSFWSRLFPLSDWSEFIGRRSLAVSALAAALVVGILPSVVATRAKADQKLARQSIHFNVFTADSARTVIDFVRPSASETHR
jgi:hypothetical protein